MRIAYLVTTLAHGGAERLAVALAERMRLRGHTVLLLALRRPPSETLHTTLERVHLRFEKRPLSLLAGLCEARRLLLRFQPDLIHSHTFPANLTARILRASGLRAPLVCSIHNVYEGGWARMRAYRLTDGLSRANVAVSAAAAESFVRQGAARPEKVGVLTNGIDLREFAPDAARGAAMRRAMNAGADFVWLAAGRIAAAKDYPTLLRALAHVRAARPEARLWVAGEGNTAALKALAAALGVADAVSWLGLRRDLPALLDAADGFALSSAWEGMPLVVAEAMAMQKLVVATDVGGVAELMGATGRLVSAGDPEALARAMLAAMSRTPEERAQIGAAARERVAQHFDVAAKAEEWERLYGEILV
jgi:glycosyltransferase involved in cell wall biosynthesis